MLARRTTEHAQVMFSRVLVTISADLPVAATALMQRMRNVRFMVVSSVSSLFGFYTDLVRFIMIILANTYACWNKEKK